MTAKAGIRDPLRIGSMQLPNRLFRAPLLEGAGLSDDPAGVYTRSFLPNAAAGVGLIVQGTVCVTREGRPSAGMNAIDKKADMMAMAPMTAAIHRTGAKIVTQLGHGGMYCIEHWNDRFAGSSSSRPIAPSEPRGMPRLLAGRVRVLSTRDIEGLVQRFGLVALWAREAGYDGIELSGANGKLMHQFLSRTYNRRDDRYGGSLWRRTTFLREIRKAIGEQAGWDYPVLLKYPAHEVSWSGTGGISLDEGVAVAAIAEEAGFDGLTPVAAHASPNPAFCRGDFPADTFTSKRMRREFIEAMGLGKFYLTRLAMWRLFRQFPFSPVWNRAVFSAVKARVNIPVFAVGGIRQRQEADQILGDGQADMIGIGRPFYAEPELARFFLAERQEQAAVRCSSCNLCILPQLLGNFGACYNPRVHQEKAAARKLEREAA
jgi:2,4-dienoyl-CoA reductase-like NADH-dependent reductase (Old Yellow Enzyme family)